ncbi:MAG: hypothetical protein U0002_09705 [Thermoanaerobaculia bacterium]
MEPERQPLLESDRRFLTRAATRFALRAAGLGLLALGFLALAAVAAAHRATVPWPVSLVLVGGALFSTARVRPALARWRLARADLEAGEVELITSEVAPEIAIGAGLLGVQHPLVRAGGEVYEVDRPLAARLKRGGVFRLRVAMRCRLLLGAEDAGESAG